MSRVGLKLRGRLDVRVDKRHAGNPDQKPALHGAPNRLFPGINGHSPLQIQAFRFQPLHDVRERAAGILRRPL